MIEIFPNEFGFLSSQRLGLCEGGGERGDDRVRERGHQEPPNPVRALTIDSSHYSRWLFGLRITVPLRGGVAVP
jgi:hypothetical protein